MTKELLFGLIAIVTLFVGVLAAVSAPATALAPLPRRRFIASCSSSRLMGRRIGPRY